MGKFQINRVQKTSLNYPDNVNDDQEIKSYRITVTNFDRFQDRLFMRAAMSLSEDMCFPKNPRSSRPWLFKMPGHESINRRTTNQDDYQIPAKRALTTGRRRQLLERFFWQEICREQEQEDQKETRIEDYKTEYNSYDKPIKETDCMEKAKLVEQYPLYAHVAPITFWKDNQKQVEGVTTITTPLQPFRRSSSFSKPLSEILDEPKY